MIIVRHFDRGNRPSSQTQSANRGQDVGRHLDQLGAVGLVVINGGRGKGHGRLAGLNDHPRRHLQLGAIARFQLDEERLTGNRRTHDSAGRGSRTGALAHPPRAEAQHDLRQIIVLNLDLDRGADHAGRRGGDDVELRRLDQDIIGRGHDGDRL